MLLGKKSGFSNFGKSAMLRFTFLIAAVVVLSVGGVIGYLLPLP